MEAKERNRKEKRNTIFFYYCWF